MTGDLPPGFSGAARNDLLLAGALSHYGIEPTLVSHRFPGQSRRGEIQGVNVLRLPRPVHWSGKPRYPLALVALLLTARPRPQIVRFRGFGLRRAVSVRLCRLFFPKVRIVVQPACFGVDDPASITTARWGAFKRRQLLSAHGWLAMNRGLERSLQKAGGSGGRVATVRNPVDLAHFVPAELEERSMLRQRLGLPVEARIAVSVGGLSNRKRQAWMTAAASAVMREDPALYLVHAGPRAEDLARLGTSRDRVAEARRVEQEILTMATDSGIADRVRLTGLLPDVAPVLRAADLFLHAATSEGEANAVNEAMACALPCILPSHEVFGRQGSDACRFSFRDSDKESFRDALREILGQPERARTAGLEARQTVEETRAPESVARDYALALARAAGLDPPQLSRQEVG